MNTFTMRFKRLILCFLLLFVEQCSLRVERPVIHPRGIEQVQIDQQGITVGVILAAYNPNGFELPLHDLQARVLFNNQPTGAVITNLNAVLQPQREIPITATVMIPWNSIPGGVSTLLSNPETHYQIQGTIRAHRYITVTVSFTIGGTISRHQIEQTAQDFIRGIFHLKKRYPQKPHTVPQILH